MRKSFVNERGGSRLSFSLTALNMVYRLPVVGVSVLTVL